jgi:hypothetical protein
VSVHPALIALLNKVDIPGARAVAYAVPVRIIRIVQMDDAGLTFRVEQLVEHGGFGGPNPRGAWTTLSTHGSQIAGQGLGPAMEALWQAQKDLVYKLTKQRAARMPPGLVT